MLTFVKLIGDAFLIFLGDTQSSEEFFTFALSQSINKIMFNMSIKLKCRIYKF